MEWLQDQLLRLAARYYCQDIDAARLRIEKWDGESCRIKATDLRLTNEQGSLSVAECFLDVTGRIESIAIETEGTILIAAPWKSIGAVMTDGWRGPAVSLEAAVLELRCGGPRSCACFRREFFGGGGSGSGQGDPASGRNVETACPWELRGDQGTVRKLFQIPDEVPRSFPKTLRRSRANSPRSQRMAATSGSGPISGAMRGKLRSFHPMAPRLSESFDGPVGPTDGQDPSSSDKLSW